MNPAHNHLAAAWTALALVAGASLAVPTLTSALHIKLTKKPIYPANGLQFHTLPDAMPPHEPRWTKVGADEVMSAEAAEELGTANYISRWYERVSEDEGATSPSDLIQLHCAYYTGMLDTVPHVPERCMVGGGMMKDGDTRLVAIPLSFDRLSPDPFVDEEDERGVLWTARSAFSHNRVRLPRGIEELTLRVTPFTNQEGTGRVVTGYFFIANGRVYSSADDVRIKAFELREDYAYYAKIQFMSPTAQSAEELAALAGDMLRDLFPEVMRRLPDWTLVERGEHPESSRTSSSEGGPPA